MANWTTGARSCAAAIFMYKRDDSVEKVKPEIERINYEQGRVSNGSATDGICGEHHTIKAEFTAALSEWNDNVQPGNAFLCIYAHADKQGICPFYEYFDQDERKAELITWVELGQLLRKPVQYLWLLGCTTEAAMAIWNPSASPVSGFLLATSAEIKWDELVGCFEAEISMDPVRTVDEVIDFIRTKCPTLSADAHYFKPQSRGWVKLHDEPL
jgi:hypothetical protein